MLDVRPDRPLAPTTDVVSGEAVEAAASADMAEPDAVMRWMASRQDTEGPSASDLAYGGGDKGIDNGQTQGGATTKDTLDSSSSSQGDTSTHEGPTSSHDGGFTGFGAEFDPYSYTDPNVNHDRLDPAVQKLGVQHTRIFIPLPAIQTSLLGQVGPDWSKQALDKLAQQAAADPNNAGLQKKLQKAQTAYARDVTYVESFMKTMELAGKQATINLTLCGGVGHPYRVEIFGKILAKYSTDGYHMQATLENEPNGPDKSDGFRGRFNKATNRHDKAGAYKAAGEYVAAYKKLDETLESLQARQNIGIVGGDMVGNHRKEFFEAIVHEGLNQFVDAYSFHIYWGAGKGLGKTLDTLADIKKLAAKYAPGKPLQITEFGKERFSTAKERAKDPSHKGATAVEKGVIPAYEQGLFALSAVNIGYTGLVKWDAFWAGAHKKGDGKGDGGEFEMIDSHYRSDATARLFQMFTHATQPGWLARGTNHGVHGAEVHFESADGENGAILAMSEKGRSISTAGLPKGMPLYVMVWNGNGHGGVTKQALDPGLHTVHIPVHGAVAITTKLV